MPLTPAKRRLARAEMALAEGRTDFKSRAPRKRTLKDMQAQIEDAEARTRRASELLEQSLEEIAHQRRLVNIWRARANELERIVYTIEKIPLAMDAAIACRTNNI